MLTISLPHSRTVTKVESFLWRVLPKKINERLNGTCLVTRGESGRFDVVINAPRRDLCSRSIVEVTRENVHLELHSVVPLAEAIVRKTIQELAQPFLNPSPR